MSCRSTMKRSKQLVQITIIIRWLFILILSALISVQFVSSCLEEEKIGLLQLKSYFKSYYHPIVGVDFEKWWSTSYNSDTYYHCCESQRVICSPSTGNVIRLDLLDIVRDYGSYNNTNELWLFNVTLFRPFIQLIHLNLEGNNISGLIEHDGSLTISSLQNLQTLVLDGNPLRTSYVSFDALSSLRILSLGSCELSDLSMAALGVCELRNLQDLHLSSNHYFGEVPSCLSNLTSLKSLDIAFNQLNGEFPYWLPNLTLLEHLDLSCNSFEGQLTLSSLANLSMLQSLVLESSGLQIQTEDSFWMPTFQLQVLLLGHCNLNRPHGVIPSFLTHQYNLSEVDLSNNNLTGSFPSWLFTNNFQLHSLELRNNSFNGPLLLPNFIQPFSDYLDFSSNRFEGKVPNNIGSIFPNLMYLNMSSNNFEGYIQPSIAHMGDLRILDVSRNKFSGELSKALFTRCRLLEILIVSDNNLQGDIIPEFMNLTILEALEARNNNFSGIVNNSLKRSPMLKYLDISNNSIMGHLPSWIGNLSALQVLLTSNNSIHGHISREICKLQLLHLDLSLNDFTGPLPQCSNFSSLITLRLSNNKFIGLISNSLSNYSSLREIDLGDNLFSGFIPSWIYKFSSLRALQLDGNKIHGEIPHEICQLVNIDILDLSRNQLYGSLPMCFSNMSFGMREHSTNMSIESQSPAHYIFFEDNAFIFDYMDLMDQIIKYVRDAVEVLSKKQYYSYAGGDHLVMSALDLSCNNLSGGIPSKLGDLRYIHSLNLSHNNLFGSIPISFSNLEHVESLDLSYNQLIGTIPSQLIELNSLAVFNVSFNNLSGRTPETGQFGTFDESSYLGNPELCVSLVNKSCLQTHVRPPPTIKQVVKGKETSLMEDFFWSFGVTSCIAFLTAVAVVAINPYWRKAWFDFVEYQLLWWRV